MTNGFFRAAASAATLALATVFPASSAFATVVKFEFVAPPSEVAGTFEWDLALTQDNLSSYQLTYAGNDWDALNSVISFNNTSGNGEFELEGTVGPIDDAYLYVPLQGLTAAGGNGTWILSGALGTATGTFAVVPGRATVPEPATLAMLAAGLFGVGFARKKRAA